MNARELALDALLEMEQDGVYANTLIRGVLDKYDYEDPREKAFFKRLVEGTLEHGFAIDWALDRVSRTPVAKMKPLIRALLRLSACQILYLEHVPDSAACNEAVKLARKRGFSGLSGFVNGVLRSLSGQKETLAWPDPEKEPVKSLSLRFGLPEWLIALWREQYGQEALEARLPGFAAKRPVIIRFSRPRGGAWLTEAADVRSGGACGMKGPYPDLWAHAVPEAEARTVAAIRAMGVMAAPHPLFEGAYALENVPGVEALPGFAEGQFYVQDVSSMLAVAAAGIGPGMRVLDLCSAPGGKAILAAEYAGREGRVLAGDVSGAKTAQIEANLARMGCENIETRIWDACVFLPELEGWADVVLADVPCSGFGVLSRKKDIRYRVRREDLDALTKLQGKILAAARRYVRPGGVLLYSTCTVDRLENEDMAEAFVRETEGASGADAARFAPESLDPFLPARLRSEQTAKGMLQLWPGQYDTDGFFMARLRRLP